MIHKSFFYNRISTRQWAMDQSYNAKVIFTKLFHDDIKLLLTMDKLWAKRRPPTPLVWDELSDEAEKASEGMFLLMFYFLLSILGKIGNRPKENLLPL